MDYQAKTNWTYNDTVTEQDMNRIEAGLGDLHQRLDTPATSKLVLQPGTQTIQVERDTPFHLSGISGRMLLNLLGRNGNCESLNGWAFSGTAALNTSQFVTGTASIQITAGSGGGIMSRSFELKAGKTYVLAASIKLGTATGAAVSVTGIMNGSVVNSSSNFMTSYMRFTATSSTHSIAVVLQATQGQTAYVDAIRLYEISAAEYSQLSSMTASQVDQMYPYTEGLAGVQNPYAIRWTSAAKTDVAAMLAFDTELLAPPVPMDDVERDRLEQGVDGQYYKVSNHYRYSLTGDNISIITSANYSGYKWIRLQLPVAPLKDTGYMIKFDGSIISRVNQGAAPSKMDQHVILDRSDSVPNSILVTVANSDSGWGEDYVPSAEEIKAYFYGWVMGTQASNGTFTIGYNKTGTKAWRGLVNDNGSGSVDLPRTYFRDQYSQPDWKPYELMYKRSIAINASVSSEGTLSLVKGDNVIEVGSGLILREASKPLLYPTSSNRYMINYIAQGGYANPLNYMPYKIVEVYRNNRKQQVNVGTTSDRSNWYGGVYIDDIPDYRPEDVYSVTYLIQDKRPIVNFIASIPNNEYAMIDHLIRDIQQTTRRISVVENKKAENNSSDWITPTLLNGWVNRDVSMSDPRVGYRKMNSSSTMELRGIILGGPAGSSILFKLPKSFRPAIHHFVPVLAYASGSYQPAYLTITPSGDVVANNVPSSVGWYILSGTVPLT